MDEQRTMTLDGETLLIARLKRYRRIRADNRGLELTKLPRRWWEVGAMPQSDSDFFRALCGRRLPDSERYCSGDLGYVYREGPGKETEIDRDNPPRVIITIGAAAKSTSLAEAIRSGPGQFLFGHDWYLFHEEGLRETEDGVYAVITKPMRDTRGQRRGRRPIPQPISKFVAGGDNIRGIVGQYPPIPTSVVCPHCNRKNRVLAPED